MRGSLYVPKGYILANGAEVLRADYPRLVAFADENELWRDETVSYSITGTFAKSAKTITAVSTDDLDKVEIGDTLTATGLASGTLVIAKDYSNSTITISVATTAAGTSLAISGTNDTTRQLGMFGKGDGETTFILPNYVDKMTQFAENAGRYFSAGLPNITGSWENYAEVNSVTCTSIIGGNAIGALSKEGSRYPAETGSRVNNGVTYPATIVFNARSSNFIYGNSDTVQPPAITLYPIMRY